MKHTLIAIFALLLALPALADDKAAQIDDLQSQIAALDAQFPAMKAELFQLTQERANDKFSEDAYVKQNAQYELDHAALLAKQADIHQQWQGWDVAWDNWKQRSDSHKAKMCYYPKEHPEACAAYDQEAKSIDDQGAALKQQANTLKQKEDALNPEIDNLNKTFDQLKTIKQQNDTNYQTWSAKLADLRARVAANLTKKAELQQKLAILQNDKNACLKAIPPVCAKPDTPAVNAQCEHMHAVCGAMFDGN